MRDQKNLWIKMHQNTTGYDAQGFRVKGLSQPSLQHLGNTTAKCMQYLQHASDPIRADTGIWRLWEDPLDVPRASHGQAAVPIVPAPQVPSEDSHMKTQEERNKEEIERINRNLNNPLSEHEAGTDEPNPVDGELQPPRTGPQRDQRNKIDQKSKDDQKAKDDQALRLARSKAGPPIGQHPSLQGQSSSSNRVRTPPRTPPQGTKRSAAGPASPDSIAKLARTQWQTSEFKMRRHDVENFPKYFKYHSGKLYFVLDEFTKGLSFSPESYAPILQVTTNGRLKYINVTPYNIKWLPKDEKGRPLADSRRVRF